MENQVITPVILKEETVTFFKSKLSALAGKLVMSDKTIKLTAHKQGVSGFGLLGAIAKAMVEKEQLIFELPFSEITSIRQGKQGFTKNVLEITDKQNNLWRMGVKNYADWEQALTLKMSGK